MPAIVDSGGPVLGTPVVSTDGVLTATPRLDLGAVLLTVRFGASAAQARSVTVFRGDGSVVRGLDAIAAPSGVTAGIDAEPGLGAQMTYTARANGVNGASWTSTSVAVTVARHRSRAWLKSILRPELSLQLYGEAYPEFPSVGRVGALTPLDASYAIPAVGVPKIDAASFTVHALTLAEQLAVERLLRTNEPMLLQADAFNAPYRPDVFMVVRSWTPKQPAGQSPEVRSYDLEVLPIQRPKTAGSTVHLPGRSIAALAAQYPTVGSLPSPPLRWLTG